MQIIAQHGLNGIQQEMSVFCLWGKKVLIWGDSIAAFFFVQATGQPGFFPGQRHLTPQEFCKIWR